MLFVLATMLVAPSAAAQVTCTTRTTSAEPPPTVTVLRSHRDFVSAPGRVGVDGASSLYVTDPRTGRVVVRNRYGQLMEAIAGLGTPLAVTVDGAGNIYVADESSGNVWVYDRGWRLVRKLGDGDPEFALPNDIAIDAGTGRVYVSDGQAHTVRVYSPAGALVQLLGGKGAGPGMLDFPSGVWVSPSGEIFVADQTNNRIQVFDRGGTLLRCFAVTSGRSMWGGRVGRIQGLTGDATGRLYVTDAFHGLVRVFDRWGGPVSTIGAFGERPGELQTPTGVAIDRYNRLFVTSSNNARVEVFGLDAFTDPHAVQAIVQIRPGTLNRHMRHTPIRAVIELPGHPLDDIRVETITANGVPAVPTSGRIDNYDDDPALELRVAFDAEPLLATLADGEGLVLVTGSLRDGTEFEGTHTVRVLATGGR